MLTHDRLVKLYRDLDDQDVLSIYVDGDQHDPAQRDAWRTRLDAAVAATRRSLSADGNGRSEGFEQAWVHVARELRPLGDAFLPHRGWVAFATSGGLRHAEGLTAAMPDLVRWERGIRVAPYVRALKQERPVYVAVVDSRRARLFEHVEGDLHEMEGLRADTFVGDLTDVGVRKRASRTSGQRGETSSDHAQRILDVASDRMLKSVIAALEERAGAQGVLVLGGTPEMVHRLATALPRRFADRVEERPALHFDMTVPEVRQEVRSAAGDLRERTHLRLVQELADAARSGGNGSLGAEDTEIALREGRVDTLLLSRDFIQSQPDYADQCVGTAFAQGADVEEVSGEAGEQLDREGGGVVARLRFRTEREVVSSPDRARSSVG